MGKINYSARDHRIVVELSFDDLLMAHVQLREGVCMGYTFAFTVAQDKIMETRLAPELLKMKRFKVKRENDKIVVTMDDVDPQTISNSCDTID
jgi:hypothetical protein